MSEYFIIIPLVIIIIAFYFAERHDKNACLLKSLKDFLGNFNLLSQSSAQTRQSVQDKRNKKLFQKKGDSLNNKSRDQDQVWSVNQDVDVKGTLDLNPIDSSKNSYAKIKKHDYLLNSRLYRETKHYIPETTYSEDIEIKLDGKIDTSKIPGYQNKDHFTYYFGKDFDHLY